MDHPGHERAPSRGRAGWPERAYWNAFLLWHIWGERSLPYRPLEQILETQSRRVRAIVAHAYATAPYYRRVMDEAGLDPRDFRTAGDLAQLPSIAGEQLAEAPEQFISRCYDRRRGLQLHSTGTLGLSKHIHHDPAALFLALAHGHRQRIVLAPFVGRTLAYREMVVYPPESVSFQMRAFYEAHSWVPRGVDLSRAAISPADSFESSLAAIDAFRPDVLRGYGSYLGALFRRACERGVPIHRPKAVVYGADRMPDADRALIEEQLGVPVLSTYQSAEVLRIGFQCERREAFHMNVDRVAFRVVDARGNSVAPGERGEIVISDLTNRATVLLNYRLGDMVTAGHGACPCGRTLPTIERIEGRADDLILRPGGEMLHPMAVLFKLERVRGVVQVQLVQEELQRFLLRAVCAKGADWDQAERGLHDLLRSTLGEGITVHIERMETIPTETGGKVRTVISHCRRQGQARA